jgi:hypothetical protein
MSKKLDPTQVSSRVLNPKKKLKILSTSQASEEPIRESPVHIDKSSESQDTLSEA